MGICTFCYTYGLTVYSLLPIFRFLSKQTERLLGRERNT